MPIVKCSYCGKEKSIYFLSVCKRSFCDFTCKGKWQSINLLSKNNPNYKAGRLVKCDTCGKEVYKSIIHTNNFCSRICFTQWKKINAIGENSPFYKGTKLDKVCKTCEKEFSTYFEKKLHCSRKCWAESTRRRETVGCSNCGSELERLSCAIRDRKNFFCSRKCNGEWQSRYIKGENHPNWIEDRSKLKAGISQAIRDSIDMDNWRFFVYKRDKYTCMMCGTKNKRHNPLNAHHIKKFSKYEDLRFDPNNGITLCLSCHRLVNGKEESFEDKFVEIVSNKNNCQLLEVV